MLRLERKTKVLLVTVLYSECPLDIQYKTNNTRGRRFIPAASRKKRDCISFFHLNRAGAFYGRERLDT
jgi:hypothetical protein